MRKDQSEMVEAVEQDAATTGVDRDLEEAAEMVDIVERDAATTGVGRDLWTEHDGEICLHY
jgi:hypothetical protein